jgi:predicted metal-dependent peptidase
MDAVERKLAAARTRLILDRPFLGALVLRLPLIEGDPRWLKTTATDARALYYNHQYIEALTLDETQFMLAHDALHCALTHFSRRQHRDRARWDVACDLAINPLLIADGLRPPPNALFMEQFEGMTAEEIYPCVAENTEQEPLDQHLYDGAGEGGGSGPQESRPPPRGQPPGRQATEAGSGASPEDGRDATGEAGGGLAAPPPVLGDAERQALAVQWQQRMAGAAQQAQQAGKLSGVLARLVDHLLQPQLPWRMLLARYLSATARDDYTLTRPNTRREGPALYPSLRSAQIDVAVVVDSSGSIGAAEMAEFLSEVNALKGQLRARLSLHACDAALHPQGPWVFEPWEEACLPALHGGGGTRFEPAFEWAAGLGKPPDLLLYFTDAQGSFPRQPPAFPVLWLVKGRGQVPFGQRIQLN